MWYYNKALTCVTLIKDRRFLTLVNLPLLEVNSQFNVYRIHNIPFPYFKYPESKLSATYTLEMDILAVNEAQTQYVQLTTHDLTSCYTKSEVNFCTLRNPVYNVGSSQLCVIAVFKRDQTAIADACQDSCTL